MSPDCRHCRFRQGSPPTDFRWGCRSSESRSPSPRSCGSATRWNTLPTWSAGSRRSPRRPRSDRGPRRPADPRRDRRVGDGPAVADRLHELRHHPELEHAVEYLYLDVHDLARKQLRATSDAGTDYDIVVAPARAPAEGAVWLLE